MTLDEFREWSKDIPGDVEITTLTRSGYIPLSLKRAVLMENFPARHGEPKGKDFIVLNPMGTHFDDKQWGRVIKST